MKKQIFTLLIILVSISGIRAQDNVSTWLKDATGSNVTTTTAFFNSAKGSIFNPTDRFVQQESFKYLYKPFLTRALVADKGIIKMGSGFSLNIDDKEATVAATYSKSIFQNSFPMILSGGFNSVLDPDNNFVSLFKGNKLEFGFGGNIRLTGQYSKTSVFFKEEEPFKLKKATAVFDELDKESKLYIDYLNLYPTLSKDADSISKYIKVNEATLDLSNKTTISVDSINVTDPAKTQNQSLKDFYTKFLPANPTIADWIKIRNMITDTLAAMKSNVEAYVDFLERKDNSAAEYARIKKTGYDISNINDHSTGFSLYFWDVNAAFDRRKYTALDLSKANSGFDELDDSLVHKIKSTTFSLDLSPISRLHMGPRALSYLNINLKWTRGNTYSTLTDDDKITVQSSKMFVSADSVEVQQLKEYKGFDNSLPFKPFNTVDIKLYGVAFWGTKKTAGLEGSLTMGFRPDIKSTGKEDQKVTKLDLSTGLVVSIPAKDEDGKDEKIVNLAFLLNFNDLLNSNAGYKPAEEDTRAHRIRNRFGFGVRIGLPINKILL